MATLIKLASLGIFLGIAGPTFAQISDADVGNWTVGNCILAQFAMEFSLRPIPNDNTTLHLKVDRDAKADTQQHFCGNETQDLNLHWFEMQKNDTSQKLARNLTITFGRVNHTYYGVSRLYGIFELAHFKYSDPTTNKTSMVASRINVDTGKWPKLMFQVPFKRSYLCADLGDWSLTSYLDYSFQDKPLGTQLPNATISTKKIQFDAFRTPDDPQYFRTPMDCDYNPSDIVPIVVGAALASVVVFVLIAYMCGRRRHRQRGYQSV